MVRMYDVNEFLAQRHIAVVGASDVRGSFAKTVYRELRSHGYDVVPSTPRRPLSTAIVASPT
jgi:predicted CoA-binding protein